jgi:hypothetical protein
MIEAPNHALPERDDPLTEFLVHVREWGSAVDVASLAARREPETRKHRRDAHRRKCLIVEVVSQEGIVQAKASAPGEAGLTGFFVANPTRAKRVLVTLNLPVGTRLANGSGRSMRCPDWLIRVAPTCSCGPR